MPPRGTIIEFIDNEVIRFGYVKKEEPARLQIVDGRGRNLTIPSNRVITEHGHAAESDFPSLTREIADRITAMRAEVDVELLWQSLTQKNREMTATELTRLFFGESRPEAVSALFRALIGETLFFKRSGSGFLPRTPEQVQAERQRRQREQEREAFRESTMSVLRSLAGQSPAAGSIPPGIVDRLHQWLTGGSQDEAGAMLEEIAGVSKARNIAYSLLVREGRIPATADRHLVLAGIDERFSAAALAAASNLQPFTHEVLRRDFRGLDALTIDDDDTKEVDDALTIRAEGSDIVVGIHIADVSAFVLPGDPLDLEAARRGSTIYLPTRSVPMFPERLSSDLASLNVGPDRPTLSLEARFDAQMNLVSSEILLGMIRVSRRLSYAEADRMLGEGDPGLSTLHQIASARQALRVTQGAATLRRNELKIHVDTASDPPAIHVERVPADSPSRMLVAEFMILLNGLIADYAAVHGVPVIYRTQEPRDPVQGSLADLPEPLVFEKLRRTFKRSRLSLTPGPHSGLGLSAYTQASSPIRRYADLVTQRQLTAVLRGQTAPWSKEQLLESLTSAEGVEQQLRQLEAKADEYWLLMFLRSQAPDVRYDAIVLDGSGTVELSAYGIRGRIGGHAGTIGQTVQVLIEAADPEKGIIRFRPA